MTSHRAVMTAGDLAKVGHMLSKQYGITVQCTGTECWTNGDVINLPQLPEEFDNQGVITMLRYFLDHEVGHLVGDTDFQLQDKVKAEMGEEVDGVVRFLEDLRCESVMKKGWLGCDSNISGGQHILLEGMNDPDDTENIVRQWAVSTLALDHGEPRPPFVSNDDVWEYALKSFNKHVPTVRNAQSTKGVLPTAIEVVKELHLATDPPPEGDGGQGESEGQGEGKGKEGDSGGSSGDQSESQEVPDEMSLDEMKKELEKQKQEAQAPPPKTGGKDGANKLLDLSQEIANKIAESQDVQSGTPDSETSYLSFPWDEKEQYHINHIRDLEKKKRFYRDLLANCLPDEVREFRQMMERRSGVIQDRLRQMLQSEARNWWQSGYPNGQPDPAMLAQLALGLSDKVMRKKKMVAAPDTAVMLLVDNSSSMSTGYAKREAMLAAALFSFTLEICGHPNFVAMFHCHSCNAYSKIINKAGDREEREKLQNLINNSHRDLSDVNYTILKTWDEKYRDAERHFVSQQHWCAGGTPMGDAIRIAQRDLCERTEKRKVLMVFGDGCPNDETRCKYEFDLLEKIGLEHVLIGIGPYATQHQLGCLTDQFVHAEKATDVTLKLMEELEEKLHIGESKL